MLAHRMLHRAMPTLFSMRRGLPLTIPGPPPSRFLSTAGPFLAWGRDSLGHASKLFREHGDVVALVRGGGTRTISTDPNCPGTVLAYGPEHTRAAATMHDVYLKGNLSGALYPGDDPPARKRPLLTFGAGLFSVNGEEHRRHRRLLTPAFSKRRLQGYFTEMVSQTRAELDAWRPGELRDTALDMRRLTSNIAAKTLFGTDGGSAQASQALQETLHLMGVPLTRIAPFDLPAMPFSRYLDAAARLEDHMRAVLAARREEHEERDDILSALLRAQDEESGTRLTENEILGHVSVFFAAGHETSANALSWTLFLLASFPEVHARVAEELAEVLDGESPTVERLEALVYLDWVVKESLRLFPPGPYNGRLVAEPTELGGYELPAGTELLVSIYETHRMPELYADPTAFRPERWETLRPSPYEYNPFSAGPRTCIGARFATMEIKAVLSLLLQRYRLALAPQRIDRFAELVLSPRYGLKMVVQESHKNGCAAAAKVTGDVHDMVQLPV